MIYNEDCLEGMKEIPSGSVDAIICDPPYCVGATSNGIKATFSDFNLMRPFWEQCFIEFARLLKEGAHIYLCTDWRTYPFLYPIMLRYLSVKNLIVWEHGLMRPGNWYRGSHELIMFAVKGKSQCKFSRSERDLWRIKSDVSTNKRLHPSQKPLKLLEQAILNSTEPAGLVLDSFMGSGSTGVACVNTGRRFIGFELDEGYFEIAKRRIDEAILQREESLFDYKHIR